MRMDFKMLEDLRERRDEVRRKARAKHVEVEELDCEYRALNEALHTVERVAREHADFNESASDLLR